jgi:putative nucleotidyltransferase with HDIG domain
MRSVPSLPSIYLEILDALKDPDCSLPRIGSIISRDAGMTAKILQLANSAFFGLTRQVSTPSDAIFHLGLETVQALALGVGVFSSFHSAPLRKLGLEGLWEHSVATGALAKKVARRQTRDSAMIDAALTGGLLHDLGKLVLAAGVAAEYGEALERARHDGVPECEAEKDRFGATHAEVGAYLTSLWALPHALVEALAYHHYPAIATTPVFARLRLCMRPTLSTTRCTPAPSPPRRGSTRNISASSVWVA